MLKDLLDFVGKNGEKIVYFVSPNADYGVVATYLKGELYSVTLTPTIPKKTGENEAIYIFGDELDAPGLGIFVKNRHLTVISSSRDYWKEEAKARANNF